MPVKVKARGRDGGFSFIELLAYMAIAALLILAAIPQFNHYRAAARDAATRDDVRSIAVAYEAWSIDNPGRPYPVIGYNWGDPPENMVLLESLGVTLSEGTVFTARDRTAYSPSWVSTTFLKGGEAFCIWASNPNGSKYTNFTDKRLSYHSGNGGMGSECSSR